MRELVPIEELRVPKSGWRYFCPYCDKTRYFKPESGVMATLMGRCITVRCQTCKHPALIEA
jgi:hypothetical protein